MKKNCETISDDGGIEVLVGYEYEKDKPYYEEPGNVATLVEPMIYTELKSVEVVIKGRGIDILPLLHPAQKEFIIANLQFE